MSVQNIFTLIVFLLAYCPNLSLQQNTVMPMMVRLTPPPFYIGGNFMVDCPLDPNAEGLRGCNATDLRLFDDNLGTVFEPTQFIGWRNSFTLELDFVTPSINITQVDIYFYHNPSEGYGLPDISYFYSFDGIIFTSLPVTVSDNSELSQTDNDVRKISLIVPPLETGYQFYRLIFNFSSYAINQTFISEIVSFTDTSPTIANDPIQFLSSNQSIQLGSSMLCSSLQLSCTVTNNGSFIWSWSGPTVDDSSTNRTQVLLADTSRTSVLSISRISANDNGTYTCTAHYKNSELDTPNGITPLYEAQHTSNNITLLLYGEVSTSLLSSTVITESSSVLSSSIVMISINNQSTFRTSSSIPFSSTPVFIPSSVPSVVQQSRLTAGTIGGIVAGSVLAIGIVAFIIIIMIIVIKKRSLSNKKHVNDKVELSKDREQELNTLPSDKKNSNICTTLTNEPYFTSDKLISSSVLDLQETIGQGEFGIVYRAVMTSGKDTTPIPVAVKTLKGLYSDQDVASILEECHKMSTFNDPHVLTLIGVCLDMGPAPCIVMPYMGRGSLLSYLKRERPNLTACDGTDDEIVLSIRKQLLSMCLQVAQGMTYLASVRFVHRDLAARNCMIDNNGIIKVADFGLTEDVYSQNYFRQSKDSSSSDNVDSSGSTVKLPIKWMALESLHDGIFTEKSDVWSFGVLCWEVFCLGKSPYPGMDPLGIVQLLDGGGRLLCPLNQACSQDIYDVIMMSCWRESPDVRPTFDELVNEINEMIKPLANYIDLLSANLS